MEWAPQGVIGYGVSRGCHQWTVMITLLVENGVPGCLLFWRDCYRDLDWAVYLSDRDPGALLAAHSPAALSRLQPTERAFPD
jgi:hypothetical protein